MKSLVAVVLLALLPVFGQGLLRVQRRTASGTAPTFVNCKAQDTGGGAATSIQTGTVSLTAGNTVYAFTSWKNASCAAVTTAITDVAGNTFTQVGIYHSDASSAICSSQWMAKNVTGNASNQYTATASTSVSDLSVSVLQASGGNPTTPSDTGAIAVGDTGLIPSTSTTTSSFTTTYAWDLLVSGLSAYAYSGTFTADTGYTINSACTSPSGLTSIQYKSVATIQTGVTAAFTHSATTFLHIDAAGIKGQ